ncbi:hypothetical protein ACGFX2_29795 [Streptomyces goshikiensis]|uniref:hypothetical protein n=1 Tax=Streptomyces goshikiensis TaxID=1942 RepID=UPI00371C107B
MTGPLCKAGWEGVSATCGFAAMEATETRLGTAEVNARLIATVLDALATKMRNAQRKLRNAVPEAKTASTGAAEMLHQLDPFDLDKRYGGAHARDDVARVAEFAGIDPKAPPREGRGQVRTT